MPLQRGGIKPKSEFRRDCRIFFCESKKAFEIRGWAHQIGEPFLFVGPWRSLVSALVWGTRGPEFESRWPDHFSRFHCERLSFQAKLTRNGN